MRKRQIDKAGAFGGPRRARHLGRQQEDFEVGLLGHGIRSGKQRSADYKWRFGIAGQALGGKQKASPTLYPLGME